MLLQLYILDYTWIITVAILIGLSLVLSYISEGKNVSFVSIFVYMTIINAFLVSTGNLPMWSEVILLLVLVSSWQIKKSKGENT